MITIYNLSEGQEDCFLIKIATGRNTTINILVDGGKSENPLLKMEKDDIKIDELNYIVLTHIDNDHIKGLLKILNQNEKCENAIIIYNRFVKGLISFKQAEQFEKLINNREVIVSYKEYQNNIGDICFLSVGQRKKLQKAPDKVYITFLAPGRDMVQKLYDCYECYKRNINKSNYSEIVNKSSIIFILEYREAAILMTGDGYISDIMSSINHLFDKSSMASPLKKIDLVKIAHHGSSDNNKQLSELLEKIKCRKVIITNSKKGNVTIIKEVAEALKNKIVYTTEEIGLPGENTSKKIDLGEQQ